jgi:hypothetical protein
MSSNLCLKHGLKYSTLACLSFIVGLAPHSISADEAYWHYTVKKGDNLIHIARKHFWHPEDWRVVQQLNHIRDPLTIPVGRNLKVPLALVKHSPASAMLILIQGEVMLAKGEANFITAQRMSAMQLGDALKTGEDSLAVIQFADGSLMNLQSNAELVFDNMQSYSGGWMVDTQVKLKRGQVQVNANPNHRKGPQMRVITPNAIAAVRGTIFRVSASDETQLTTQETLEGSVGLANSAADVIVNRGYGTAAALDKAPLAPVPLLPAINIATWPNRWQYLPIKLTFPYLDNAVAWHVKLFNPQSQLLDDVVIKTPHYEIRGGDDGQYQLSVSAIDQHRIEGYEAIYSFAIDANPLPPLLSSPTNQTMIRLPDVAFAWQQASNANHYVFQLANNAHFNQAETRHLNSNQFTFNQALEPSVYYWRVASVENGKQGPYSAIQSFQFLPLPPAPDANAFNVKTIGNRVTLTYLGQSAQFGLHVQLKHPRFPNVEHSEIVVSANTLNEHVPVVLELREYGTQQLMLSWVDDTHAKSDTTEIAFTANNPYPSK